MCYFRVLTCFVISCLIFFSSPVYSSQEEIQSIIHTLDQQIDTAASTSEKAKLYCFLARNYSKIDNVEQARANYILALNTHKSGWLLNEYGYFLYRNGMYELAWRASQKVIEDYPYLKNEAKVLQDKAFAKFEKEYYEKNPPTIIMDTVVDKNRVTRHDLVRNYRKRNPLPKLITVPRTQVRKS
ncbi:tetratricopeptide repeat protein [Desulfosediminicola flagellatus]|uniref:tetratricopeptide repeat protein n=1 Tax=Desulfosediminicola flagellatus TaxID=2569541 RepID=UPI0010AD9ED3|nr:hypothetical protein [Desulfosediminicola flagellatus]